MSDDTSANFTIKDVSAETRRRFRGYAERHGLPSRLVLEQLLDCGEAQEMRIELLGPTIDPGGANLGRPDADPVAQAAQLASAGLKPPGWLISGVWRQIAAQAGVAVPARRPPRRRTETPEIADERVETWRENSRLDGKA